MIRPLSHIERLLQEEALKGDRGLSPQKIPLSDQKRILNADIREVIRGRTVIYDDRDPRSR